MITGAFCYILVYGELLIYINIMASSTSSPEVEMTAGNTTSPESFLGNPSIGFEFVVHGILITSTSFVGFLCNIVCLIVMSQPGLNRGRGSSVNVVLTSMAGIDIVVLLSSLLMCGLPGIVNYYQLSGWHDNSWINWLSNTYPLATPLVYPIGMAAQTASVYLTVIVTIERYIAVCWPLEARSICTQRRARILVIVVCSGAVLYNISRFFEYSSNSVYLDDQVKK